MKSIRERLTYANVMATIAAFFAIGGGAVVVAATDVTSSEFGKVTVRTENSPATDDADGNTNGGALGVAKATAKCKNGEQLLGGGAKWTSGDDDDNEALAITESFAAKGNWKVKGTVDFGAQGTATLQAQAICLVK